MDTKSLIGKFKSEYIHQNGQKYDWSCDIWEADNENLGYIKNDERFTIAPWVEIENENTPEAKYVVSKILCNINNHEDDDKVITINKNEKKVIYKSGSNIESAILDEILKKDETTRKNILSIRLKWYL